MQNNRRIQWRGIAIALTMSMLLLATLLSFNLTANPVNAQDEDPTETPSSTDPTWRAFLVAREVLEEEFSIDLTYVQQYSFEPSEWFYGIDDCDGEIFSFDYRPYYIGWTYRITSLRGTTYQVRVSYDLEVATICDDVTESDAFFVEGTPDPSLPAPVAGSAGGGAFELGGHVLGLGTGAVQAMQQSGMTWVKKQLRWSVGDDTSTAATMIQDAHSKGFKILLGIVGQPNQMGDYNNYVSQFASFVGQVAALGADAIEVWNEPNIDREWPNGQVNGATYVTMLAAASNAIRTANSNTIVISAAPAPTGAFGAAGCTAVGCNDDVFMQQMAEAGASQYIDCVGLHYNEGIVSPATNSGDPRGEYPTYYFGSMLARGYNLFGGTPVCFTELGYLTGEGFNEPIPSFFAWAQNTSLAQQAAWLADAASRAAQSGRVRLMIIWNVNFTQFTGDPMGGYAMIRPDGSCPSCASLGAVMGG